MGLPEKRSIKINLPLYIFDRMRYIRDRIGVFDEEDVIVAALNFYDLAVCVHVEQGQIFVKNRDGSLSKMTIKTSEEESVRAAILSKFKSKSSKSRKRTAKGKWKSNKPEHKNP